jgi:selT/selW/selH-like putative selenoprotein
VRLADELLDGWAPALRGVELMTGTKGRFEVTLDGELIFSKEALGRHAEPGEVKQAVARRLGEPLVWRE